MSLMPFFCYFGGKWRAAPHYPAPRHSTIIEPFAGAAGYATRYADRQVILCEADATVAALWRYLIQVRPEEIRALPDIREHISEAAHCPSEAQSLIGFWLNKGMTAPCKTPSKWMRDGWRPNSQWGPAIRERIATQVDSIRHWVVLDDYRQAPDCVATWFVDPPYYGRLGARYRQHAVDFSTLGQWCRTRPGQVIVCENEGATWLPFQAFRTIKGAEGKNRSGKSIEVLWTR